MMPFQRTSHTACAYQSSQLTSGNMRTERSGQGVAEPSASTPRMIFVNSARLIVASGRNVPSA